MSKQLFVFSFLSVSFLALSSCQHSSPAWKKELVERLDSMIVLSESHLSVVQSLDSAKLVANADEMRQHLEFFNTRVGQTDTLYFEREVYTGPLFDMANCDKYYQRVLSGYLKRSVAEKNTEQLKDLRATVRRNELDSATAVAYYLTEAQALNSANNSMLKSYGGCFACMREHDSLSAVLDSLSDVLRTEHGL